MLGVDIGATNTKLAALSQDGELQSTLLVDNDQPVQPLVINYVNQKGLSPKVVAVTGVGGGRLTSDLMGVPLTRVDEFTATGLGGLRLAGVKEAVVVSMGTGTAFVHASPEGFSHIIGTGVGGGTMLGLCCGLTGATDVDSTEAIARGGNLNKVDLTIGEVAGGAHHGLDPDLTASNFASVKPDATDADWALGAMNLVLQTVGTMGVLCARLCGTDTVVLTGALTRTSLAPEAYRKFSRAYGLNFLIPEHAAFSTAIGAALAAGEGAESFLP